MLIYRTISIALFLALFPLGSLYGATWRVEKDGSGDFSVIQHAVDAASEGDTILVGAGRFDDFEPFNSGYWIADIIVVIQKDNLTLIGAGVDQTIIGPEVNNEPYGGMSQLIRGVGANNVHFENMAFENCANGIVWISGAVSILACKVSFCFEGGVVSFTPDGTTVENCEFHHYGGVSVVTNGECDNILVSECSFWGPGTGVGFNSTTNATINSCMFSGCFGAIGYSQGSSGQVLNCQTSDVEGAVYVSSGSQVNLVNNFFPATTGSSIYVVDDSHVSGSGNVFSGGFETGTLSFGGRSTSGLHGNHIIKGDNPFAVQIRYAFYEMVTFDLSNNYWGTTDTELIDEWIYDWNDDQTIHGIIEYLPLADGPVSTEEMSLDSVKALYR